MRIFICPLDWGLGHAARCVPIIKHLQEKKIEVVVGAEGRHLFFLKEHFPGLEYIEFPGYRISYSKMLPVGVRVVMQLPQMIAIIKKEHKLLREIIDDKKIDAVISDNRYGLWNEKVPCVIMTHQLNIRGRLLNTSASKTTHTYIRHFDECWIPDYIGEGNLSGTLSHPIPEGINGKYLGPLSRFESASDQKKKIIKYDLLVILSGPEPQRSKLEEIILKQLKPLTSLKAIVIQGLPGNELKQSGLKNIEIVPHLADKEFEDAVNRSEVVLCRAGYSTLMDLYAIGWKKSIFIPTPGQTEQEYLGKLMQEKGMAVMFHQNRFSLKDALEKAKQLSFIPPAHGKENFKGVIDTWLKTIV